MAPSLGEVGGNPVHGSTGPAVGPAAAQAASAPSRGRQCGDGPELSRERPETRGDVRGDRVGRMRRGFTVRSLAELANDLRQEPCCVAIAIDRVGRLPQRRRRQVQSGIECHLLGLLSLPERAQGHQLHPQPLPFGDERTQHHHRRVAE